MNLEVIVIILAIVAFSFFVGSGLALGNQKKFCIPAEGTYIKIEAVFDDGSFVAVFNDKRKYYNGNVWYSGSENHKYPFIPAVGDYIVESRSERYCRGTSLFWEVLQKID